MDYLLGMQSLHEKVIYIIISLIILSILSCITSKKEILKVYDEYDFLKEDPKKLIEDVKNQNFGEKSSDFLILQKYIYELTEDGKIYQEVHKIHKYLKVNDDEQVLPEVVYYLENRENIIYFKTTIINPGGEIKNINTQREESPFSESKEYYDFKTKYITLPKIKSGTIVDTHYQKLISRSEFQNQLFGVTIFSDMIPIFKNKVIVVIPKNRNLLYKSTSFNIAPNIVKTSEKIYYIFEKDKINAIENKIFAQNPEKRKHRLFFSTMSDVDSGFSIIRDNIFKITNQQSIKINTNIREITRGSSSDIEKAKACYNYVTNNIKNIPIPYGLLGYKFNEPDKIFSFKAADGKDKCILLLTMLKEVGINAELVFSSAFYDIDMDFFCPEAYSQIIIKVSIDDKIYYLDPLSIVYPFGILPSDNYGSKVLICNQNSKVYAEKIDYLSPKDNSIYYKTTSTIAPNGKINCLSSFYPKGSYEANERLKFYNYSDMSDLIKAFEYFLQVKILKIVVDLNKDLRKSFNYSINFVKENIFDINDLNSKGWFIFNPNINSPIINNISKELDYDLYLGNSPFKESVEHTIKLKPDWKVSSIPKGLKVDDEKWSYKLEYSNTKDSIKYLREYSIKVPFIKREDIKDFRKFLYRVEKVDENYLVIESSKKQIK